MLVKEIRTDMKCVTTRVKHVDENWSEPTSTCQQNTGWAICQHRECTAAASPGVNVPLHVLHYHTLQVKRIYQSKLAPPPASVPASESRNLIDLLSQPW